PLTSTLFPYTTLFRSELHLPSRRQCVLRVQRDDAAGDDARARPAGPRAHGEVDVRFRLLISTSDFFLLTSHFFSSYSPRGTIARSEEHTSELQSRFDL